MTFSLFTETKTGKCRPFVNLDCVIYQWKEIRLETEKINGHNEYKFLDLLPNLSPSR